jgi:AraC family transcriptional regulator
MEQAKRLLRDTDLPVGEIGVRIGFVDASHFTRAFRQETGRSPKAYRSAETG